MTRAWASKNLFLVGPQGMSVGGTKTSPRKGQVSIGPQEFPPPSEEEIQDLVDKLKEAASTVDEVLGYASTLNARFGAPFVDYGQKISEGIHYLILWGTRPGPPAGFEAQSPEVEIRPARPTLNEAAEERAKALPGKAGPEAAEAAPPRRPTPAAAMRMPPRQALARILEAVEDVESLVGDHVETLADGVTEAGHDPESVYNLSEVAGATRDAVARVQRMLGDEE